MIPPEPDPTARFYRETGLKPLNPVWAKLEIALGLVAAGAGQVLITRGPDAAAPLAAGVLLFALGGYLALAGHRSHLYQSGNRLAAYLADLTRSRDPQPEDRR
jgi:hypothetical protein